MDKGFEAVERCGAVLPIILENPQLSAFSLGIIIIILNQRTKILWSIRKCSVNCYTATISNTFAVIAFSKISKREKMERQKVMKEGRWIMMMMVRRRRRRENFRSSEFVFLAV